MIVKKLKIFFLRLFRRLFNGVTLGILCILVIAVVLLYTSIRNTKLAEVSSDDAIHSISEFYLKELGERRAVTISNKLNQTTQNIYRVFSSYDHRNIKNQDELREYMGSIQEAYGYDKLAVVDEDELMYTEHSTISGVSRYSFLTEDITAPSIYTADLYGSRKELILAVPLDNTRIADIRLRLVFVQVDIGSMLEEITDESEENETICDVYYSNGQNMTVSADPDEHEDDENILNVLKNAESQGSSSYTDVESDFISGRSGFTSYVRNGVMSYMYYTPVEDTNWMLSVTIQESSISNKISDIRDDMLLRGVWQIVIIVIVLMVVFSLFLFYNRRLQQAEKKHLIRLSQTDAMTKLYNRGGGEKEIRLALEAKAAGVFLLMDADKFKSINDTFGHDAGDKVIIAIADALRKSFRDEDIVMRLGGDEFAVYAPGITDEEILEHVIVRLFATIDAIDIPELKGRRICISIGAAFFHQDESISFTELYKRADENLYISKEVEGNKITVF